MTGDNLLAFNRVRLLQQLSRMPSFEHTISLSSLLVIQLMTIKPVEEDEKVCGMILEYRNSLGSCTFRAKTVERIL